MHSGPSHAGRCDLRFLFHVEQIYPFDQSTTRANGLAPYQPGATPQVNDPSAARAESPAHRSQSNPSFVALRADENGAGMARAFSPRCQVAGFPGMERAFGAETNANKISRADLDGGCFHNHIRTVRSLKG